MEVGVLDRHRGLGAEPHEDLLVITCELGLRALVGHVEVASEGTLTDDRHGQQRADPGMVWRNAGRAWIAGDVANPESLTVVQRDRQQAQPLWWVADQRRLIVIHSRGHELGDAMLLVHHGYGSVTSIQQPAGLTHDAAEDLVQRQLAVDVEGRPMERLEFLIPPPQLYLGLPDRTENQCQDRDHPCRHQRRHEGPSRPQEEVRVEDPGRQLDDSDESEDPEDRGPLEPGEQHLSA